MGRALRYRVRSWLRSRLRLAGALSLLIALLLGVVMASAVGARRTETSPERYLATFGGGVDVTLYQDAGASRVDEVRSLPSVAHVDAMTFMFGIILGPTGEPVDAISFAGSTRADAAHLVDGREPEAPGEFVATRSFLQAAGMSIGDAATLVTQTSQDSQEHGFDIGYVNGPRVAATLVGIVATPSEISDSTTIAVFPRSVLGAGDIGSSATVMGVGLRDGSTVADLRAELRTLPDPGAFRTDDVIGSEIMDAVNGQALGLWLLAAIGAMAAVAASGYVLRRNVQLTVGEEQSLRALGSTRAHLVLESAVRAACVAAAATVLAWAIAIALSSLFPFGFARRVEPHPGVHVQVALLLLCGAAMFLAVVLWVAVAAAVRGRVASSAGTPLVDSVASRCPRASMATGLRFALSSRPGESAPVTLGVAGTAAVVAGLIGSLTFAVGYRDLVDDAARYGHNFDIDVDNGAAQVPDEAIGVLLSSPAVAAAELYTSTQVQVAGTTQVVAFSGHEPARGDPLDPVLLEGRQPVGDQEIALGGVTAHRLGLSVGDEITLADDGESATYTITGLVIPADIGGNDLVGQGAVVTAAGFDRLDADRAPSAALVRLDPDASPAARAELAESFGVDPTQPLQRPPAIVTMSRITFVPYALAILLAVLATIVLAASIYSSLRTREHQVAVLRSLGADRRWLIASAAWHAVVAALVPAALGAPIGVIAGRLGFRAYADHRGLVSTPVTPVLAGLGFVAALLVVAAVVALAAGRAARRTPPAVVLRTA